MKRAQLSDGTILEFPDETPDEVMDRAVREHIAQGAPQQTPQQQAKGVPLSDVTAGMSGLQRFIAGLGTGGEELLQGTKQLLNIGDQEKLKQQIELSRQVNAPFKEGYGAAGNIVAKAAPFVAASFIPGAQSWTGAAALGALQGAIEPSLSTGERLGNIGFGTAGALGGQALGRGISRVAKPMAARAGPQGALVAEAQQLGINLPASARTGSQRLGYLETTLAGLPGGGKIEQAYRLPQEQLAAKVMEQAGGRGLATQATLEGAKKQAQATYKEIAAKAIVQADDKLMDGLSQAQNWANRYLSPKEAKPVANVIDDVLGKIDESGAIPGDQYQALRSVIRRATPSDEQKAVPFRMVKRSLDDAFSRSVPASEAALKKATDRQYAIQKAIEPLIPAAEARGGVFTPSGLLRPLGDFEGTPSTLAKIGPLLREPPQSGTAQRLAYLGLLGGVGGTGGYLSGGPEDALKGAALGIGTPMLASRLLASPAVQRYLAQGLLSDPTLINQGLRVLPPLGALALPAYVGQ